MPLELRQGRKQDEEPHRHQIWVRVGAAGAEEEDEARIGEDIAGRDSSRAKTRQERRTRGRNPFEGSGGKAELGGSRTLLFWRRRRGGGGGGESDGADEGPPEMEEERAAQSERHRERELIPPPPPSLAPHPRR